MSAEILQEFLVQLGWKNDEAGMAKFKAGLASVASGVAAMAVAVEGAALAVVAGVTKITHEMDGLYFASQRTGAAVVNIKALQYAAQQLGLGANVAAESLGGLARFLRNNPGGESFLKSLGVQARDGNNQLRDTGDILTDLGKKFSTMPMYLANAYGEMLGINEETVLAMRRGVSGFSDEYKAMAKRIGFDSKGAAEDANKLWTELRHTYALTGLMGDKIGSAFTREFTKTARGFREFLEQNAEWMTRTAEVLIRAVLRAAEVLSGIAVTGAKAVMGLVGSFVDVGKITAFFEALRAKIVDEVWPAILEFATAVKPALLNLWAAVAPQLKAFWDDLKGFVKDLQEVVWPAIKFFCEHAGPAFKELFGTSLKDQINKATEEINGFAKVLTNTAKLLDALKNGDWTAAREAMGALYGQSGISEGLTARPDSPAEAMQQGISGAWQRLKGWVTGTPSSGNSAGFGPSTSTNSASKAAFIEKWGPEAKRIAGDLGTSPENILAHWGQETGWGAHEHDNNPGNLQASAPGNNTVTRGDTHADGSKYQAPFFRFNTPSEAADAYKSWILRHGAPVQGTANDPIAFGNALRSKGYMENPNAAQAIANARQGLNLSGPTQSDIEKARGLPPGTLNPDALNARVRQLRDQATSAAANFSNAAPLAASSVTNSTSNTGGDYNHNQNITISVDGSQDPQSTADLIRREVARPVIDGIRNGRSAVQ